MALSKCYICNSELISANRSAEHILPNCIGGRLKSNQLVCKDCNSLFGQDIDKELCAQLNFFANILNVKRQRGKPQNIVLNSRDNFSFIWTAGQRPRRLPTVESTAVGEHRIYKIIGSASSKELQRVLRDFLKKPNAKIISDTIREEQFVLDSIRFTLGGKAVRSVMKTCLNLWMLKVGDRCQIEHLLPFVRDGKGAHRVSFYYPEGATGNNFDEVFDEISHRVLIKGDRKERILYAYVEFFSAIRYLVLLSDNYSGPDREIEYSWDVLARKKVNEGGNIISLSREQLLTVIGPPHDIPMERMRVQLNRLLRTTPIALRCNDLERSFEKCSKEVLKLVPALPITSNNLHVFALGRAGFLIEIYDHMLRGFILWADPALVARHPEPATRCFLALTSTSLEIAKTKCFAKYSAGTAIDRESLITFVVELLLQTTGYMGGEEEEAMEMFVRRHKPTALNALT
jgi:hypothetical protein